MNSKLKLNLEELSVDSFDTSVGEKPKGTVFGEQCTCYTNCTCPGCPTCYASCNGTCDATCANTCANTCDDNTCVGCPAGTELTWCNCPASCYQTNCYPYECCA